MIDLGLSPLCQSQVESEALNEPETFHPLPVKVCHQCWLVQTEHDVAPDRIFPDYAYFSSYSETWLDHAWRYARYMTDRFALGAEGLVVEIAARDAHPDPRPVGAAQVRPTYVLVLPCNLTGEIIRQTEFIRSWGGSWVVPIPEVRVVNGLPDCTF